ncbi:epimerase [Nocardioides szechwanensis]|uniref:UDP-2-acetamido-2,6-beta-L-arabino-hexul-4-ose reductase n=1 Tax=Nocardioides szechwanensis TaxID=1005944 RepID=A0A1H0BQN3_9ACTN|nr:NAD-dependent epimerase/dehydratase family protein [Nocardioides szechwanensis]GEP33643.1 epimerase [Nocardioides szechwanensis]SDN47931.1 UDP-2-acetamido-2,6-beta-L-arabino-hexul-4-ose reductase [Nocardioides szechwanensis]
MKVVITGGHGFLGWHTACRLRALRGVEARRLGRGEQEELHASVAEADVVIHIAGINRAASDAAVQQGNEDLARELAAAVVAAGRPIRLVYANSIQADLDNPYGVGKAAAASILRQAAGEVGGSLADVLLPNLFGEHGKPHYNSFVATFCRVVADGGTPSVTDDKAVLLLHAQSAAQHLIDAMEGACDVQLRPEGELKRVSEVLSLLRGFHELYERGETPALTDPFLVDLFNTYRSYTFPQMFPMHPQVHSDERGDLVETGRSHGGTGQAFVSTTRPGFTRGDHYHLHKVERFFVVRGEAEISLRRLLHEEVVTFQLGGDRPGFVDMPTLWVHNITNVGDEELVTMFWADQLLDPVRPDQYPEQVGREGAR